MAPTTTRGFRAGEKQIYLDPAPLFAWLRRRRGARPLDLAEFLGVSRQRVDQWKNGTNRMSVWTADEVAVHYGAHAADIWGEQWWQAIGVDVPPLGWPKEDRT